MIDNGWWDYLSVRSLIFVLHSIGPICTAYAATTALSSLLFRTANAPKLEPWTLPATLHWYCIAETAFFVFFLWYRTHLQREATHPPLRSREERKALFEKARSEIKDPRKFLSGWFKGANIEDIRREDAKDFLSWVLWDGRVGEEDKDELEEVTRTLEEMIGQKFEEGRGAAKALRLTLDPIEMQWRSLLWYGIIMLVDTASHLRMLLYGMKYHYTPSTSFEIFPPRPLAAATASKRSPAKDLSYWLRPHTSKTRLPVLWIHGIGVGMHPHIEFLHELDTKLNAGAADDDEVGILSVEILQISSRLTHSILTREKFLDQITQVLDCHDWTKFVLVSHSYGSVFSTHLLTDSAMSKRIASTFLIDPVTILLHMPDVAYNFTVRKPRHANEWQLWYFASKDPGTSHTLGRHFFWSQNVLWRDSITTLVESGMGITVSLASRDLIVDTEAVGAYLMQHEVPNPVLVNGGVKEKHMELKSFETEIGNKVEDWKSMPWKGAGLEVMWWDDLDHAQVFDEKNRRARLVDVLVKYSGSQ